MAIESLRAVQDDQTNVITDFFITFKMIRTVQAYSDSNALAPVAQARLSDQSAGATDLGTQTPAPSLAVSAGLAQMGVA